MDLGTTNTIRRVARRVITRVRNGRAIAARGFVQHPEFTVTDAAAYAKYSRDVTATVRSMLRELGFENLAITVVGATLIITDNAFLRVDLGIGS